MDESLESHSAVPGRLAPSAGHKGSHLLSARFAPADTISRATSPGLPGPDAPDEDDKKRYRPRTFSYFELLPFPVEAESDRDAALQGILTNLYTSVRAEDFSPGALHWTRELHGWINLKFEMTRELRARLAKLYYHLCLAPGLDSSTADRFARMLITLTRKKHFLKPGEDLTLDWRPLWNEFKGLVLPSELAAHQAGRRRSQKFLLKLCLHANTYFDPAERRHILDELLPYFSTGDLTNAYIVVGALNVFVPTGPAPLNAPLSRPSDFVPTFFHLWSLMARSKIFDVCFIDIFSRMAKDLLHCAHVPFAEHGIFTKDQSDLVFTAILRLTDIPVGQGSSPYSSLDSSRGVGIFLEKDRRKYPVPYMIARWVVHSLSPLCCRASPAEGSVMASLEGLMESVDTFFHPSNQGPWTSFLAQLTYYLTDIFVSRWNREQTGELDTPPTRCIDAALRRRFVLALREVTFMGLFSKSSKVVNYYYSTLQGLTFLEPGLMLPGALQRFYPSLQGLVEVHRTTSSLCGLQMIANIMAGQKGFRCHITALLALALPGIDANDLGKTQHTLNFIQSVAYSIPFVPLGGSSDGNGSGSDSGRAGQDTSLAMQWVQGEMERMEREGQDVAIDYAAELSDGDEADILRSSTAGFGEFVLALLGKVFTLLENLPDPSHMRTNSPEENVINTLPAALTPLFATLSPALYDSALDKLAAFVSSHVVHQARDAIAWICNALCKAGPEKALRVLVPTLIVNIRNEIDYNGAGSDRSSGTEVLPRDRALVWYVSILSMCVVHVGSEVLAYKDELFSIAQYMQERCRGLPTIHISNFAHHLLLNLTHTYPIDNALYEPAVLARGLDAADWGRTTSPSELTVRWHRPSAAEIHFALELFESQVRAASRRLESLTGDDPPVSRKGKNKEWSDELSRSLTALRLLVSGLSALFDPKRASSQDGVDGGGGDDDNDDDDDDDPLAEVADDEELERQFHYPSGYLLDPASPVYERVHDLRDGIGRLLSRTHAFLSAEQEDDVACFTSLYAAYRTWITDVGIERSAHSLERLVRLYRADVSPFKISGLRKVYPRPLLVKRADVYQLQRVKHNATYRRKSALDRRLLLDLAESCVSPYADVRRVAQGAQDSSLKVLIGGRTLIVPVLLDKFRRALDGNDHDRIKGAMYTLIFSTLLKTLLRDWRFAPDFMRMYIDAAAVDKQSIQDISSQALVYLLDFGRPFEHTVLVDRAVVDTIRPAGSNEDQGENDGDDNDFFSAAVRSRSDFIRERRSRVEEEKAALGLELTERARVAHWKIANRCIIFATNLSLRFATLAPPPFVDLVVRGTNDPHPGLRGNYQAAFSSLFTSIDMRAVYDHSYRNFLLESDEDDNKLVVRVPTASDSADNGSSKPSNHGKKVNGNDADCDPGWTERYLDSFSDLENPEYFVDNDFPGWLVWGREFTAARAKPAPFLNYDEVETAVREQIGAALTRDWCRQHFDYLKQEPREPNADRFRMQNVVLLMHVFDLMNYGKTAVTLGDVEELVREVYGDGSDRHQHRATSEILGALLAGSSDDPPEFRDRVWSFAAPMVLDIIADGLTPDNLQYWMTCLHLTVDAKDPRRSREFTRALGDFRLDMSSNAAFKESSKVQLLEILINDAGWHFRRDQPVLDDFLAHIDHPYKSVREAIGRTIGTIYRTRYHESFPSVAALLARNRADSSVGLRPYRPAADFAATVTEVFARLERWRAERTPGQQTPSSYTSGSKTVLVWLDSMISSQECTQLAPFFPDPVVDQLLHMMDVKEDPELMKLAYHVYRQMSNIPLRDGEDAAFVAALVRVGRTSPSWHQRLRALVNMQVIYFRRIFLTAPARREQLFDAVGDMLADPQLEVRDCARATLAGMIRCSPAPVRNPIIRTLKDRFEAQLRANPMPPRNKAPSTPSGTASGTASGTDTPVDAQRQVVRRHAAVLGLGALVEAFPYATPPPAWMPDVLAHLATRAASDRGIVGKAAKGILAEFKKTRQDSWSVDQKYFTTEQLEALEGVLWKSYFA